MLFIVAFRVSQSFQVCALEIHIHALDQRASEMIRAVLTELIVQCPWTLPVISTVATPLTTVVLPTNVPLLLFPRPAIASALPAAS